MKTLDTLITGAAWKHFSHIAEGSARAGHPTPAHYQPALIYEGAPAATPPTAAGEMGAPPTGPEGEKAEEEGQPVAQDTAPSTAAGETGADRKNEKTGEETAAHRTGSENMKPEEEQASLVVQAPAGTVEGSVGEETIQETPSRAERPPGEDAGPAETPPALANPPSVTASTSAAEKPNYTEEETQRGCTAAELARRDCRWGLDPNMPLPFEEFLRGPGGKPEEG